MEQRAALNMKSVVASDNFGDITGGNIGEFMKYMPGVVMDYVDADARAVRIGGLDPKYAGVSIDGMRMASAASAGVRRRHAAIRIRAGVDHQHRVDRDEQDTHGEHGRRCARRHDEPAQQKRVRSQGPRNHRAGHDHRERIRDDASRSAPKPRRRQRRKICPAFVFTYADSFSGRFGIQLSLSATPASSTSRSGITHDDRQHRTPRAAPIINTSSFATIRRSPRAPRSGANFDYQDHARISCASLRTRARTSSDEINARTDDIFRANTAQIDPSSTLTNLVAQPTANANTRLEHDHRPQRTSATTRSTYTPKLEFKRSDLTLTAGGGYSRSRTHYEDRRDGLLQGAINIRLTRMSWSATRSSPTSTDWQMTQLSGRPWTDSRTTIAMTPIRTTSALGAQRAEPGVSPAISTRRRRSTSGCPSRCRPG